MAPTQQSAAAATEAAVTPNNKNNNNLTTNSTCDFVNSLHKVKKESYSSSSNNNRLCDATQRETLLPISCKGHFFHDAFFEDARQHFEAAVRNVLDRHGHARSGAHDDLTSYRMLRQVDLSEGSQAATVTESSTCHQVVMDVRDFMAGDVKVKVVDEDEVVVEGSVEQRSGGSVSKKSFRRSFTFPGLVQTADITSTMSSDGVLTVTVPKKEHLPQITNITIQESNTKTNTLAQHAKANCSPNTVCENTTANTSADTTKPCTSAQNTETSSKSRTAEENTKTNTSTVTKHTSATTHSQSVASSASAFDNSVKRVSEESQRASDSTAGTKDATSRKPLSENDFPSQPSDLLLPIFHGGLFFQDSFFAQAHQEFEEAMKKVLHAAGESAKDGVMASYRSLRERHLTDENQAVSHSEDSQHHKVVMDVRDFMAGDVKVKVVGEDEVVVEGSVEQRSGGSVSKKSFRRSFTFPGLVKAADITSTMSSDGVLTVTVPKKEHAAHTINITVQESNAIKNTSADTTKSSTSAQNTNRSSKSRTEEENTKTDTTANITKTLAQSAHQTAATTHSQSSSSSSSVDSRASNLDSSFKRVSTESQRTSDASTVSKDAAFAKLVSENGLVTQPSDLLLPISHSGLFFQDSFFAQAHQEFEEAMKKVLHAAGESPRDDVMTSYRSLRERHLSDENQAVSLSEDSQHHKVVMDVRDFMAGDVKVKVVNEDEVVVEGSVEQRSGGSVSTKSFYRSFTFPGLVKAADITSTMSSDGVLTVTVPKKESSCGVRLTGNTPEARDAATTERRESASSVNSTSTTVKEGSSKTLVRDEAGSLHTKNRVSSRSTAGIVERQQQQQECSASRESVETTSRGRLDATGESWVLDSLLPVFPKGPFFHDSFFEESRRHFETAVKEALGRLGQEEETPADDFSLYRSLRAKDLTDESVAFKVTEDEHGHQVVLDVRGFQGGDVQVKVVGRSEVQVEARLEKEEGGCKSSRSFRRRFHLPGVLDVDAVTSALSSDGILTIKAPKGRRAAGNPRC